MGEAIIARSSNVTKSYVDAQDLLKVDKVEGKSLSTNDYDNEAKSKVDGLGTASKYDTGISEGNIPILDSNGKLNTSVLPSLAITDTYICANETDMLATSVQKGDICIRTDENKTYILHTEPSTVLENWVELATPTDTVASVNGKTGAVTINAEDIGAVQKNDAIIGSTKCKITYDSKGLVTSGEDLSVSDIPDLSSTYEEKTNKSDSYTNSSSTTYASTKALVDGLATKVGLISGTMILTTNWELGEDNVYTQTLSNSYILSTDIPIINIKLSDDVETARTQLDAWANISRITIENGYLKFYCYDSAPEISLNIQYICIR